jgi:transposase InsO family protein
VRPTDPGLGRTPKASERREHEGNPVVPGELIHRQHAGSQYTAPRFTEQLALDGIAPSIDRVGDAHDNSPMDTITGLRKSGCLRTGQIPQDPSGPPATPGTLIT